MLRAVIFDFDGVITDSEVLHLRTFNKVLAQYGIELSKEDYYKNYLGLSDLDLFTLLADKGMLRLSADGIGNLVKQKNRIFEELAKTEGRMIEGVRDFIGMLSQNNILMAICSGALLSEIELILEEAGIRHFFEEIVSAEYVKKGKPHPEGFLLTLRKLNEKTQKPITAEQCVVVEDSHWGLEAGKAARMHTIAITNSYTADQLAMAEKIVAHLNHLTITDLNKLCI